MNDWLLAEPSSVLWGVATALAVYAGVILYTRLAGLRALASMSAYDMAMTVAIGSVLASAMASPQPAILHALAVLATLFGAQVLVAKLRLIGPGTRGMIDNAPLLLVEDGRMLEANMEAARVTPADLRGQLRQAGVADMAKAKAVVLETTGGMAVLTDAPTDEMMRGVRRSASEPSKPD